MLPEPQPIVGICRHGVRSLQVVAFHARRGCGPVYNLAGGIVGCEPAVPRY